MERKVTIPARRAPSQLAPNWPVITTSIPSATFKVTETMQLGHTRLPPQERRC